MGARFYVIEGPEKSGKSTLSKRLAQELQFEYTYEPQDPGLRERIQELWAKGQLGSAFDAFAKDRNNHLYQVVYPALLAGRSVVCDRYYHSMLVCQYLPGADLKAWMRSVPSFYREHCQVLEPHKTIVLMPSVKALEARGAGEDGGHQFWVIERYMYLQAALGDPSIVTVSGDDPEYVAAMVRGILL